MKKYNLTKLFTSGLLEGLTVTEGTNVYMAPGLNVKPCAGSSGYVVVACIEA